MSAQADQSSVETVRQITGLGDWPVLVTNRCVELATGLNRHDPQTVRWVRARDAIEACAEGFVVRQSAHQVIWPKTLNAAAAVEFDVTNSADSKVRFTFYIVRRLPRVDRLRSLSNV